MIDYPEFENIAAIIKKQVGEYIPEVRPDETGVVIESGDGIARVSGLPQAMMGEMIEFPSGIYGIVFNLEVEEVTLIILGPHTAVREGDQAKCTGKIISVPVGDELLGRVVNAIGVPLDGKGPINTKNTRPVEAPAPAVTDREPVNKPLQTGYKLIDALIPIGRGQRELIIGDRSTGKSSILIDTIINQKNKNVICIYVSIGQKSSTLVNVVEKLKSFGAMDYTIVIDAPASDPGALQYLAPYAGCAMAEEFMYKHKKDVLIVYDDLTKHAAAYRMLSLLLRRPPGREAYPGDVFYLHSRLLERSAKLHSSLGGGSITALPIIETQMGDISSYIPTNVISITDGQIFLENDLFNAGIRPAVNAGISVSRVGGKAQIKAMRKVSGKLRIDLAQYREKESFTLFASELDKETRLQLSRGAALTEILKQDNYNPMPVEEQVCILYASEQGYLDTVPVNKIRLFEGALLENIRKEQPKLLEQIRNSGEFDSAWEESIGKVILALKEKFLKDDPLNV